MYLQTNPTNGLGGYRPRGIMQGLGYLVDSLGHTKPDPPFAAEGSHDPAYSYNGGGAWPAYLTVPQYAVLQALFSDVQKNYWQVNPVYNLSRLVPPSMPYAGPGADPVVSGTPGLPVYVDLDGSYITPDALIAKSMMALVNDQFYPWKPGIPPAVDATGKPTKAKITSAPGSHYWNDNFLPPMNAYTTPGELVRNSLSSNSSSTDMPGLGPQGGINLDSANQRYNLFNTLNQVPLARLPLGAASFWQQSSYGLPPGQTVGGPSFPAVCPSDPNTGLPAGYCANWPTVQPQQQPGIVFDQNLAGICHNNPNYPGCSSIQQQQVQPTQPAYPVPPPQSVSPANPAQNTFTPTLDPTRQLGPLQQPGSGMTTGGALWPPPGPPQQNRIPGITPPTQPSGSMIKQAAMQQEMVPAAGSSAQQSGAAATTTFSGITNWIQANPLMAAGIAAAAFFVFSGSKR